MMEDHSHSAVAPARATKDATRILAVESGEVDELIGQSGVGTFGKKAWGFPNIVRIGGACFVCSVVGALFGARFDRSSAGKSPDPLSFAFLDPAAPDRRREDFKNIICPFLSTLVNEGALPTKNFYTIQELQDVTAAAGVPSQFSVPHVAGNFQNNPTGIQDIFNMEGAPNEHVTSTGVHDCATLFFDCFRTSPGNDGFGIFEEEVIGKQIWQCSNKSIECELPNEPRFNTFFSEIDTDGDDKVTVKELFETTPDNFNTGGSFQTFQASLIDANPIGEGSIAGSHLFIILVFGEFTSLDVESPSDIEGSITKEALRTVFVDRMFPEGFVWPGGPRGSLPEGFVWPGGPTTKMPKTITEGTPGTIEDGKVLLLKNNFSGLHLHVSSDMTSSGDPVFITNSISEGSEWQLEYVGGPTWMLKSVRSEEYLHVCAEEKEDGILKSVCQSNPSSDPKASQWQIEFVGDDPSHTIMLKNERTGFYLTAPKKSKSTDPVFQTRSVSGATKWLLQELM